MDSNAELMQVKAEFIQMTSMPGWNRFKRFAETVVRDIEKKAFAEDDREKREAYFFDARGARKFMEDLFRRIEMAKSLDEPTDDFLEVTM